VFFYVPHLLQYGTYLFKVIPKTIVILTSECHILDKGVQQVYVRLWSYHCYCIYCCYFNRDVNKTLQTNFNLYFYPYIKVCMEVMCDSSYYILMKKDQQACLQSHLKTCPKYILGHILVLSWFLEVFLN
jgi:hypothetical protein